MSSTQVLLFAVSICAWTASGWSQPTPTIDTGTAQNDTATQHDDTPKRDAWPPSWIEGVWKVESTEVTRDGQPTTKTFLFANYYVFTAGHRFSVFAGKHVRGTPMIGSTMQGDRLYCLFKRSGNRAAMRASFVRRRDNLEYVSYNTSTRVPGRYRLERQLSGVNNDDKFTKILQATLAKEFTATESESARAILEQWIQDH